MKNLSVTLGIVLSGIILCETIVAQPNPIIYETNNTNDLMMLDVQKNKEVVRSLYEQVLNKRNMSLLKELISEDYAGPKGEKGPDAFELPVKALFNAFPDIHWTINELIGDGDKVVIKWLWKGTHTGQFQTLVATGKAVTNEGMAIYEMKNGRVIKLQMLTDALGFLQQLDIIPANPAALAAKKNKTNQVGFIDRFVIPQAGRKEFMERMVINRNFIKTLPGFIEDEAYERKDEQGQSIVVTVAVWESEEAMKKAKEAVQAEYKKQNFDTAELLKRLNISMDRGVYKPTGEK